MSNQALGSTELILKIVLRLVGGASLLALIFVAAPYSWMDAIHSALGMGKLPDNPVVGYLARSTSAFYALLGGLFWLVSFDLPRYRNVLLYLGVAVILLGAALAVIDWCEGMPYFWKVWEGPFTIVFGFVLFLLSRVLKTGAL